MENDASQHTLLFFWLRGVDMNMCVSTSFFFSTAFAFEKLLKPG